MPPVPLPLNKSDDWFDISTHQVARILGVRWTKAFKLMASGEIVSEARGVRGQPYYRTSVNQVRAYQRRLKVAKALERKGGKS